MPCTAPCVRIPCNKRCSKNLSCGYQYPGICGGRCPEGYCYVCANETDARVDLLEMKLYNEIDPDETPVVVLGCGHFFTAEILDGHMGMGEVYEIDRHGEFCGFKDTAELARAVPRCPDCQSPVRQDATHRYNRVINRAVIDELSKRFLVSRGHELQALEQQIAELERNLDMTCKDIINAIRRGSERLVFGFMTLDVNKELQTRYEKAQGLQKAIQSFYINIADSQQPSTKLYNATVYSIRRRSFTKLMNDLDIVDEVPVAATSTGKTMPVEISWSCMTHDVISRVEHNANGRKANHNNDNFVKQYP
jgi:hypothetical protein